MSVVIEREHPSGGVGLSVDAFPEEERVVLGIGPLRDMKFFTMTPSEAYAVSGSVAAAAEGAQKGAK